MLLAGKQIGPETGEVQHFSNVRAAIELGVGNQACQKKARRHPAAELGRQVFGLQGRDDIVVAAVQEEYGG